jgi:hypothetical protein
MQKFEYLPTTDGAFFIDNSFLEEAMSCSRLSQYVIFRRLRKSEPSSALAYGGAIHKALEQRYAAGPGLITNEVEDRMLTVLREAFSTWDVPEGDFRTLEQAEAQIRAYNQFYQVESFTPVLTESRGTEMPFAVPFGELLIEKEVPIWDLPTGEKSIKFIDKLPIFFAGRVDLVFKTSSGELRFMDHKTSSLGGTSLFEPFYTGTQMKGYCWALSHLFGQPVRSYVINALVGRRPTRTGKQFDFLRDVHTFHSEHIAEWEITAHELLDRLFASWLSNSWPMEPRWCVGKFGKCPFFDVCMLPPSQREVMLNSGMFTHNSWNPIDDPVAPPPANKDVYFPS